MMHSRRHLNKCSLQSSAESAVCETPSDGEEASKEHISMLRNAKKVALIYRECWVPVYKLYSSSFAQNLLGFTPETIVVSDTCAQVNL